MQAARKKWADIPRTERGSEEEVGYDRDQLIGWISDADLKSLEYKEFSGVPSHTGFFSKTGAINLLIALYEHFALQGKDAVDIL